MSFQCLVRACLLGRDDLVSLLHLSGFRVYSRLSPDTLVPADDDVQADLVRRADAVVELGFFQAMARPVYMMAEATNEARTKGEYCSAELGHVQSQLISQAGC